MTADRTVALPWGDIDITASWLEKFWAEYYDQNYEMLESLGVSYSKRPRGDQLLIEYVISCTWALGDDWETRPCATIEIRGLPHDRHEVSLATYCESVFDQKYQVMCETNVAKEIIVELFDRIVEQIRQKAEAGNVVQSELTLLAQVGVELRMAIGDTTVSPGQEHGELAALTVESATAPINTPSMPTSNTGGGQVEPTLPPENDGDVLHNTIEQTTQSTRNAEAQPSAALDAPITPSMQAERPSGAGDGPGESNAVDLSNLPTWVTSKPKLCDILRRYAHLWIDRKYTEQNDSRSGPKPKVRLTLAQRWAVKVAWKELPADDPRQKEEFLEDVFGYEFEAEKQNPWVTVSDFEKWKEPTYTN